MLPRSCARLAALSVLLVLLAGCSGSGSSLAKYVPKSSELPDGYSAVPKSDLDELEMEDYMSSNPGTIKVAYFESDVDPMPKRAYGGFYVNEDGNFALVVFVLEWASEADLEEAIGNRSPCETPGSYAFQQGKVGTLVISRDAGVDASDIGEAVRDRTGGRFVCAT